MHQSQGLEAQLNKRQQEKHKCRRVPGNRKQHRGNNGGWVREQEGLDHVRETPPQHGQQMGQEGQHERARQQQEQEHEEHHVQPLSQQHHHQAPVQQRYTGNPKKQRWLLTWGS